MTKINRELFQYKKSTDEELQILIEAHAEKLKNKILLEFPELNDEELSKRIEDWKEKNFKLAKEIKEKMLNKMLNYNTACEPVGLLNS